jgi:hypothetical protein
LLSHYNPKISRLTLLYSKRKKEEGRRKKEEGRGGRRKKEEGRGGRRKKEEGRKSRVCAIQNVNRVSCVAL